MIHKLPSRLHMAQKHGGQSKHWLVKRTTSQQTFMDLRCGGNADNKRLKEPVLSLTCKFVGGKVPGLRVEAQVICGLQSSKHFWFSAGDIKKKHYFPHIPEGSRAASSFLQASERV